MELWRCGVVEWLMLGFVYACGRVVMELLICIFVDVYICVVMEVFSR